MSRFAFYGVIFLGSVVFGLGVGHSRLYDREHADRARIAKLEAAVACLRHDPEQPGQSGCPR